jgi:hypothetical protein
MIGRLRTFQSGYRLLIPWASNFKKLPSAVKIPKPLFEHCSAQFRVWVSGLSFTLAEQFTSTSETSFHVSAAHRIGIAKSIIRPKGLRIFIGYFSP